MGGNFSYGYGINNTGQVTGASYLTWDPGSHAFLYDSTGMHDLGSLGGSLSVGYSINNLGQVTGSTQLAGDPGTHAFLYDDAGMHNLGSLGGGFSQGLGINDSGQVVGYSSTAFESDDAFVYTGSQMFDLNALIPVNSGWHLGSANGINNKGWITGGGTINGRTHAFLLRPSAVPEPSALLLGGGLTLGWRLRRGRGVR